MSRPSLEFSSATPSKTASSERINTETKLPKRIAEARRLGLPDNSSWSVIRHSNIEAYRREEANKLGLQSEATWGEIFEYRDNLERVSVAAELSLRPTATWRNIVTSLLDLPTTATGEQIITQIQKRQA